MAFGSVSIVTSPLILRRWAHLPQSVMPDESEAAALVNPESLWMTVRWAVGEVWDAVCKDAHPSLHVGICAGGHGRKRVR